MTNKPDWKDAPDWANSLGIADFDCDYKGEWCWCNGISPTGFRNIELRPDPIEETKFERYRKFISEVREKTGAPMMQCLKGLYASEGNVEEAISWVKEHPGFYI